jgi:hypothetical protein
MYAATGNDIPLTIEQVEWLGDRKDRVRFPGGQWQNVAEIWEHVAEASEHYDVTKDREPL